MKVTKEMVDKDLRPAFTLLSMATYFMSKTWGIKLLNRTNALTKGKELKGVQNEELYIQGKGGYNIRLRIFKPTGANQPLPVMLYIHGVVL